MSAAISPDFLCSSIGARQDDTRTRRPRPFDATLAPGLRVMLVLTLVGLWSMPWALGQPGALDSDFTPLRLTNCTLVDLALQPDGKILVAGRFAAESLTAVPTILRLLPNGAIDGQFQPPRVVGNLTGIALQADDGLVVNGTFLEVNEVVNRGPVRLNRDGTMDRAFQLPFGYLEDAHRVSALALRPDGQIMLAISPFDFMSEQLWSLTQLNPNGSRQTGYGGLSRVSSFYGYGICALAIQSDGGVVVGGNFRLPDGPQRYALVRLDRHGQIDAGFRPAGLYDVDDSTHVALLAVGPDNKVLVDCVGGGAQLRRLNPDGSADGTFSPPTSPAWSISRMVTQADGGLLLCDSRGLKLLTVTGRLDTNFVVQAEYARPSAVAVQPDGKIVIGGPFGVARILGAMGPRISTAPQQKEVLRGSALSMAVRVQGTEPLAYAWQKDGLPLSPPQNQATLWIGVAELQDVGAYTVRVTNPYGSVVSRPVAVTVVEALTAPRPILQPEVQTVVEGGNVTLRAEVTGTEPLVCQWRHAEVDLPDAKNLELALAGVRAAQAGAYTLAVANPAGQAVSAPAVLVVLEPPSIRPLPYSRRVAGGAEAVLTVALTGTQPLLCQWRLDGVALPGATGPSLRIDKMTQTNAGAYTVEAWNIVGATVSSPMPLVLDQPGAVEVAFGTRASGEWAAVQSDGRILTAGLFNPTGMEWPYVKRYYPDGTEDPSFPRPDIRYCNTCPGGFSALGFANCLVLVGNRGTTVMPLEGGPGCWSPETGYFASCAVQADGQRVVAYAKVLWSTNFMVELGAGFTEEGCQDYIVRLDAEGSLDRTFATCPVGSLYTRASYWSVDWGNSYTPPFSACGLFLQPGGKIVVSGGFDTIGGRAKHRLARLHPDGAVDETFDTPSDLALEGRLLLAQPDGRLLFVHRRGLVRTDPDGALDPTFNSCLRDAQVTSAIVQSDGRLVVAGSLQLPDQRYVNVARLEAHGGLDASFAPGLADGDVRVLVPLPGHTLFVCGNFTHYNGLLTGNAVTLSGGAYPSLPPRLYPEPFAAGGREAFRFWLEGAAREWYALEASADLVHWSSWTNVFPTHPRARWDAGPPSKTARFFRARVR